MTRVYGGCVEPGGFELDDDRDLVACPECGGKAFERYWESCEGGSINQNHTIVCTECDHAEGDLPDDFYEDLDKDETYYDPELDDIIVKRSD
jgi:DNA-directed RNA polymerase subunit RPC12/RpoP